MAGVSTNASNLAPLNKVFRHPSKLGETGLAMSDVVDHALQRIGVLFKDGIDDISQILCEGVSTLIRR